MTIFIGLLLIAAGIGIVMKTEWILENVGSSEWAETHLGSSGGSRLLYKLIGIGIIFLGFVLLAGLQDGLLMATVGKIIIR